MTLGHLNAPKCAFQKLSLAVAWCLVVVGSSNDLVLQVVYTPLVECAERAGVLKGGREKATAWQPLDKVLGMLSSVC